MQRRAMLRSAIPIRRRRTRSDPVHGNAAATWILTVFGLALVVAGLSVIAAAHTDRRAAGQSLVLAGYLCGFAALFTAPSN